MEVQTPQQMVKILEDIRSERVCSYLPPGNKTQCDCKYVANTNHTISHRNTGEHTGCCELREAIAIFSVMKQGEFTDLKVRSLLVQSSEKRPLKLKKPNILRKVGTMTKEEYAKARGKVLAEVRRKYAGGA